MKISELRKQMANEHPDFEKMVQRDVAYQIGSDVEFARALKNISQGELAKLVNTQQSSISRLESGSVLPSLSFLQKIAEALGTFLIAPKLELVENYRRDVEDSKLQMNFFQSDNGSQNNYIWQAHSCFTGNSTQFEQRLPVLTSTH